MLHNLITIKDIVVVPILLLVVYLVGIRVRNANINDKPYYKYFTWGLWAKVIAGLAFAMVYLFYYGGGDTMYYFWGSSTVVKMLTKDIPTFLKILFGNSSLEVYSMFDINTGWPTYFSDPNSFSVCRFNVPFYLLSFGSFLGNTILMNLVLFFGVWQFYKMLIEKYPYSSKWFAYAMFFFPSIVFWSSGILKDGWTFVGILYIYSSYNNAIVKREKAFLNLIVLVFWSYIVFSIRPFMLYATLGSLLLWFGVGFLKQIKSKFLRIVVMPFSILIIWGLGLVLFAQVSSQANKRYSSIDAMLETAWIIQDDLKKDYYGGNSYDIGSFEPTIPGVIKKAPKAIVAGLFRPFVWEGSGPLMILSGLENLLLLILFGWFLIKRKVFGFFVTIFTDAIILASFVLMISLAFSIGLTTANFGALVRYAIPVKMLLLIILGGVFSYSKTRLELA